MYLCSLIMVVFQHHNITLVGTSIKSDAWYTILILSIPLNVSRHLCPCVTCQPSPIFHFLLCFLSLLIKTMPPNHICILFAWCNMFCLSLRALRYSFVHLVHAASLHLLIHRCRPLASGTSLSRSSSGTNNGCPYSNVLSIFRFVAFLLTSDTWIMKESSLLSHSIPGIFVSFGFVPRCCLTTFNFFSLTASFVSRACSFECHL